MRKPHTSHDSCMLGDFQVGNTIGQGNRHLFLAFLWVELCAMVGVAGVTALRLHHVARRRGHDPHGALPWALAFLVVDVVVLGSVAALAITQVFTLPSPASDLHLLCKLAGSLAVKCTAFAAAHTILLGH